jgi:RNA polymerase sigma-54 factor
MDRAFIQGEFEGPAAPAPARVFSAVAGIEIEGGEPVLAFFHREVWKRRYQVDKDRLAEYLRSLPQSEAAQVEDLLGRLKFIEQRKTTLYRLLEEVLRSQADYLCTGDPMRRQPLMQKTIAAVLGVHPSVVCRLVSNKSVQMPWGLEAPLGVFFPNAKDINRERLCAVACAQPGFRDEELRQALESRYGVRLSRRSVNQYRQEVFLKRVA